jgi:uncharacterized protein (DUF697 family)
MADWEAIAVRFWRALAELDVDPVQSEAEKGFRLALIGAPGSGKTTLARALAATAPDEGLSPELEGMLPEYRLPLSAEDIIAVDSATLFILLLDATKGDYAQEVAAADYLSYLGKPMMVCYNKMDLLPVETRLIRGQARWRGAEIMPLSATQRNTVQEFLVPALLTVLPETGLGLARGLPLFRPLVDDRLIQRIALVNATYASASGLSESGPAMRVPLSSEDIEVLSANQAAMAYRLGMAHGQAADWHRARGLGQAFDVSRLWQQFAREVVGLIPLWTLGSKVSLAHGATIVLGRSVQAWCDTQETLPPKDLRDLCHETASESRRVSADLVAKARDALAASRDKGARRSRIQFRLSRPHLPRRGARLTCANCGRASPQDAAFCAYCGVSLAQDSAAPQQGPGEEPTAET